MTPQKTPKQKTPHTHTPTTVNINRNGKILNTFP